MAAFGLTETGAGSLRSLLEHKVLQPSSWTAVPYGTLLAARRLMTVGDVDSCGCGSFAAHLTVQRMKAQVVDLAELASVDYASYSCAPLG